MINKLHNSIFTEKKTVRKLIEIIMTVNLFLQAENNKKNCLKTEQLQDVFCWQLRKITINKEIEHVLYWTMNQQRNWTHVILNNEFSVDLEKFISK